MIKLRKAVKRGDTISPKLFITIVDNVFAKKLNWQNKEIIINGVLMTHPRSADDILNFSNKPGELEEILDYLAEFNINV